MDPFDTTWAGSETMRQRKTWRQRNSDGRDTFEGDRSFSPPTFDQAEYNFAGGTANPEPETQHAIRWTHVFDPGLDDPDV